MKRINKKHIMLIAFVSVLIVLGTVFAILLGKNINKEVYTITFDSQGGTLVQSQEVKEGDVVQKPGNPVKNGFTFIEWQHNSVTYDFNSVVTQDMELVAYYTIEEGIVPVIVAFNYNDDNVGIKNVNIAKGTAVNEPNDPKREGYIFEGWFLEENKFDFSVAIEENTVLIAKWKKDPNYVTDANEKDKSDKVKEENTENSVDFNQTTDNIDSRKIKFADVEGVWYVEGTDDATLEFSLYQGTWVSLTSNNFDYYTAVVKMHEGRGGTEYFYDEGYFYADEITVSGNKLVYTKNNSTITFYRQKNYPNSKLWPHEKLLKEIDGYYWYLDGYKYAYLHPEVVEWYDHKALTWESENIEIYNNNLTAYEKYAYAEYKKIDSQASSNTHNTLLVNPTEFADSLIDDYKMRVEGNKLYMSIGGKAYSFTRYSSKKVVTVSLSVTEQTITKTTGDYIKIPVKVSPFWSEHRIISISSNSNIIEVGSQNASSIDGNIVMDFWAHQAGTATITIKDAVTGASTNITIVVKPIKVTGVTLNKSSLRLERGLSENLTANVQPDYAANKKVVWYSSDESVATVSSSGKVTAISKGTATISVKTDDGGYTDICTVTVVNPKLTVKASIGIGMWSSSTAMVRGVYAKVSPSGGSGVYESYYVKLYYNGDLVAEGAKNEVIVTPIRNGVYTAEVYVRDSEGNEATETTTVTIS